MVAPAPIRIALLGFSPRKPSSHSRVLGYASVSLIDIGISVFDIKLTHRHGNVFACLPERVILAADVPARDNSGKLVFRPTFRFHDDARFVEFAEALIAEVRRVHPEAFATIPPGAPILAADPHHDGEHAQCQP